MEMVLAAQVSRICWLKAELGLAGQREWKI